MQERDGRSLKLPIRFHLFRRNDRPDRPCFGDRVPTVTLSAWSLDREGRSHVAGGPDIGSACVPSQRLRYVTLAFSKRAHNSVKRVREEIGS